MEIGEIDKDDLVDTIDPMTSFMRGIYLQQIALVSTQRQSTASFEQIVKALQKLEKTVARLATATEETNILHAQLAERVFKEFKP